MFTSYPPSHTNSGISLEAYALKAKIAALLMLVFDVMYQQIHDACFSAVNNGLNQEVEL